MEFSSQKEPLTILRNLATSGRHSILIEGPSGSGKSYLSKQFANMLNIDDYHEVAPKVADIRDALDTCSNLDANVCLGIENLDTGVAAASYTLLKSLEEPSPNLYLVITCRNQEAVPDTIVSRSTVVTVGPPTNRDIDEYAKSRDLLKFNNIASRLVWQCVRSFKEADAALNMNPDQIAYYEDLANICNFKDNVSSIIWKMSHYPSGQESSVELSIRCISALMKKPFITKCGIECATDLTIGRIAQHAVLAKFAFNAKYCE